MIALWVAAQDLFKDAEHLPPSHQEQPAPSLGPTSGLGLKDGPLLTKQLGASP